MAIKLTDKQVTSIPADPAKRIEIADAIAPGLHLVIQPSGKRSWAVRYRIGGKPAKLTLGPTALITLAQARQRAREVVEQVAAGEDPGAAKKALAAIATAPMRPDVGTTWWIVVEKFDATELAPLRSRAQVMSALKRETEKRWKNRPIRSVTKHDVNALVDDIRAGVGRKRGPAPVQAARVLSYLKWVFGWAKRRDYVETNPCDDVEKPVNEYARRRKRVLEDGELTEVWQAAAELGYPFGVMVHMLILTGARLREVAEMEWREVDFGNRVWVIPPERAKNGEEHRVPLTEPMESMLKAAPRIGEEPRYVFSTTGLTPVSGFDRAKRRIDAALATVDVERRQRDEIFADRATWVFHDLRRSVASGLARLRIPFEVVERVLAHRGESGSGLRAVYNRHTYEDEKREALTKWSAHVLGLMSDRQPTNVVPLRIRAKALVRKSSQS